MNVGQFGPGVCPAGVLAERDVTADQRRFERRVNGPAYFM